MCLISGFLRPVPVDVNQDRKPVQSLRCFPSSSAGAPHFPPLPIGDGSPSNPPLSIRGTWNFTCRRLVSATALEQRHRSAISCSCCCSLLFTSYSPSSGHDHSLVSTAVSNVHLLVYLIHYTRLRSTSSSSGLVSRLQS